MDGTCLICKGMDVAVYNKSKKSYAINGAGEG